MKFKGSYIFKALTALVLALLMVFGTVATSFAAVVDDFADSGAEADIADSGAEADIADSGAELDLAESGASGFTSGTTVYLNSTGGDNWNVDSSKGAAAYFYNSDTDKAWTVIKAHGTDIAFTVPGSNKTWAHVIFTRANSSATVGSTGSWDNCNWGQTGDLDYQSGKNKYKAYYSGGNDAWEKSVKTSSATLSASPTTITTSETSTLTPGISGNTTLNEYKSVSYSISPSSGASISGNTFTPTSTGTYTVTATVTYNAKGFPDATATATKTASITVNAPACTPKIQNEAGTAELSNTTIYSRQQLKFKVYDPNSHTSTLSITKGGTAQTASNYLSVSSGVASGTVVTFTPTAGASATYVITQTCSGGGSDSVTITVNAEPTIYFNWKLGADGNNNNPTMTYDATASAAMSGGKADHVLYKLSISNWTKNKQTATANCYYIKIYDGSDRYTSSYTSSVSTSNLPRTGNGLTLSNTGNSYFRFGTRNTNGDAGTYNFYYDFITKKFYAEYPVEVTYKYTTNKSTSTAKEYAMVEYGGTATTKDCSVTGYNPTSGNTWYNEVGCTSTYNFSTALTADKTLYTPLTANEWTITLDANTNGGTIKKTSSSSAANTTTFTHTYGTSETIASQYYSVTPPTGYTLDGWYDKASGGTKYTSVTSTQNAAKTYYAHYTEVKAGATVKAYTDGSASSTGGTVKVGTGSAGATATISNSSFGIDTASPAIIRASTAAGYEFKGWETGGTYGSHVKLYIDSACTTLYNKSTHGGTYSTVYAKTDGYTANTMNTSNTEVHALFEAAKYTITNNGAYYKNSAAAYASGTTGGTFTVSQTGSLSYNTNLTLTATAASGYAVEGVYWSTDGSTWTRVTTSNTTSNGYVTVATNDTFKVTDNFRLKAQFVQLKKLSAFDSYTSDGTNVTFVTAPPKSITIKHTDAHGTVTTYTYTYDGTKTKGNPYTPVVPNDSGTLAIGTGTYGQGNYIQFFAGDEITLTYSAMASSELLKGVFYNNGTEFYVTKPTTAQFVSHTYDNTHALYMNSAYYASVPSGLPTTTVDQDAHSIKFTGTSDYKNIDVELATKRKVYFSDYTNAVIHSKNVDDYYYDNEALSVTGDQLTVKAAGSATQTNTINKNNVKFYRADANGQPTGSALSGYTVTYSNGSSAISNNGTSDSTNYIIISGNMPAYDLYIDLGISSSYTLKAGSKIMSDPDSSVLYLKQKATTVTVGTLSAPSNAYVSTSTTSVTVGNTVTLTASGLTSGYMFVGWYWGNSDDSAPDYAKGFISDKLTLSYTPKKGGTIWAVGTKELFINGSKYITGKSSNWYSENGTWKNQKMSFDPSRGTKGSYYWEITDTMFASAGSNFKTWKTNWNNWNEKTTDYGIYKLSDGNYYWTDNNDSYHGKSYFQFLDNATGNDSKSVWSQIYSFEESQEGATYGKAYMRDEPNDDSKRWNGQGFINFNETDYSGYSSPIRIYLDADTKDLDVRPTPIYSDIYVSNGYDVGSTVKTDAVTVEPVVDGVVKTSGQTGYFDVNASTTFIEDANDANCHEGTVTKYSPKKKGATVRITKKAGGSDKIAAFLIYDLDTKTVRAEKNITKGTASGGKTPYYIDLTLSTEKQRLYICPIVEESGAKVTITFDATQLNRAQWGDIVTAYAWYKTTNGPALGAYPGQPMIPSDDMSTWTTSFNPVKGVNEVAGITFSNYVDGAHSWLGRSGVMGTVTYGTSGSTTTVSIADDGIIKQYNYIESGDNKEYSRANYKAQTYDYHEPIALYDRYKNEDSIDITFQMKDGNSSLISWRHHEFEPENIINGTWGSTLRWEYLTNAKGDKYIDMNGTPMDTKPTASFYVASKGMVVYQGSKMNYVFHGGHDYEMKGYTGTYSNGSYSRSALSSWSSDITYGGTGNLDMKYAVQWYVYDAQGNYITTVLSAGIADLSSNNVDTYIGKELENKGYAVDGKSVAICYDKPRYMYGDWEITNSANNINSGPNFDAYRFEGQWIAAAKSDTTKVNVEVAMMTDSGEVLAHSRVAGYGHAEAALASGVTFTKPTYAIAAGDNSWAQTATSDAKLNGIELTATTQNFIGWYYYDANTGDFTKATYKEATGFRPNYSTKDITFYAVYRASAIYQYNYIGREGQRTYSASGEDLTAAEMANNSVIDPTSHETDIKNKVPVGIGIFKKNIDFSPTNYDSWTKTPDNAGYILDITGFATGTPTYTLTAHYKDASGNDQTITKTSAYNGGAVNVTTLNGGSAVTTLYGKQFLGWYAYDKGVKGDLLSTQANYGLQLTRDQAVIAVYDETDSSTRPEDSENWKVFIDENEVNKELTTSTSGVFYNDTIVRVRNGSDVKATLPSNSKIGVLVVCDNKTGNNMINGYTETQLNTLVRAVTSGQTKKTSSGLSITNMQATTQTSFNRTDIAVRCSFAKNNGAKYCVYAYFYDGSAYHFSAVSDVKTYE